MASDPMEQFQIKDILDLSLGNMNIPFTNSSLWMAIAATSIIGFFALTTKGKLIPGRMQSIGEMSYEFLANMVRTRPAPRL